MISFLIWDFLFFKGQMTLFSFYSYKNIVSHTGWCSEGRSHLKSHYAMVTPRYLGFPPSLLFYYLSTYFSLKCNKYICMENQILENRHKWKAEFSPPFFLIIKSVLQRLNVSVLLQFWFINFICYLSFFLPVLIIILLLWFLMTTDF